MLVLDHRLTLGASGVKDVLERPGSRDAEQFLVLLLESESGQLVEPGPGAMLGRGVTSTGSVERRGSLDAVSTLSSADEQGRKKTHSMQDCSSGTLR